jgi:hypothetical protein
MVCYFRPGTQKLKNHSAQKKYQGDFESVNHGWFFNLKLKIMVPDDSSPVALNFTCCAFRMAMDFMDPSDVVDPLGW